MVRAFASQAIPPLRAALLSAVVVLTVGSPRASMPAPAPVAKAALPMPPSGGSRDYGSGDGSGRHRMLAV